MAVTTNSIVTGVENISASSSALITNRLPYSSYVLGNSGVAVNCVSTATDENLFSLVILAGTLGPNDTVEITPYWKMTNSANNKTIFVKTSTGIDLFRRTRTTITEEAPLVAFKNLNVLNSQEIIYARPSSGTAGYFLSGTQTAATTAVDFSTTLTLIVGGQRANAGDTLSLASVLVLVHPGR